jgi:hypothetical protein
MAISEAERARLQSKIKERNKMARWINTNLNPTSKIRNINPAETVSKLMTQDDADSLERSLDAFMEAPRELSYRNRASYSMNEQAELMVLGNESERRGREKLEEVKEWISDKGVTMGGNVSNVDPIQWMDKFSERVYTYKDPDRFRSQYDYDKWKDKMYAKALNLDDMEWMEKYKKTYVKTFERNVVKEIDKDIKGSARRKEAEDILEALKQLSPEEFQYAYYTDLLGDISFLYPDKTTDAEYGVVIGVKDVFGISF